MGAASLNSNGGYGTAFLKNPHFFLVRTRVYAPDSGFGLFGTTDAPVFFVFLYIVNRAVFKSDPNGMRIRESEENWAGARDSFSYWHDIVP